MDKLSWDKLDKLKKKKVVKKKLVFDVYHNPYEAIYKLVNMYNRVSSDDKICLVKEDTGEDVVLVVVQKGVKNDGK